jgi:hypothetical protein
MLGTLKELRKEVAAAREEIATLRDEVGEAQGELLHRHDSLDRCVALILTMVRHLHSAAAKVGRRGARPSAPKP